MLGKKVRDKISGLTGTATSKTEYLNGCVQYGVQAPLKKDADEIKTWNIDEEQLEVIGTAPKIRKKRDGGPSKRFYGREV